MSLKKALIQQFDWDKFSKQTTRIVTEKLHVDHTIVLDHLKLLKQRNIVNAL